MSTGSYSAYEILGIDRDADTKTIKKAYAKLVKQYHPEEHPEEWKRIHDAYEQAMQIASGGRQKPSALPEHEEQPQLHPQTVKVSEETSESEAHNLSEDQEKQLEDIFGDVEKVVQEQLDEKEKSDKKRIDRELRTVRELAEKRRLRFTDEWRRFFSRRNLLPITSQREFLMGMGDCLTSKIIDDDVYIYLREQVERIADYLKKNNAGLTDSDSDMDAVRYVRERLVTGNKAFQKRRGLVIKICIVVFVVFELLRPLAEDKYSPEAMYQQYHENDRMN